MPLWGFCAFCSDLAKDHFSYGWNIYLTVGTTDELASITGIAIPVCQKDVCQSSATADMDQYLRQFSAGSANTSPVLSDFEIIM